MRLKKNIRTFFVTQHVGLESAFYAIKKIKQGKKINVFLVIN